MAKSSDFGLLFLGLILVVGYLIIHFWYITIPVILLIVVYYAFIKKPKSQRNRMQTTDYHATTLLENTIMIHNYVISYDGL